MKNLLLVLLMMFIMPYASASDNDKTIVDNPCKTLVGFKYSNTSTWGVTTKSIKEDVIDKNVAPVLIKNNCKIITDMKYLDKLQLRGYADASSAEKADILDLYKDDGFQYLIFIEMDPVRPAAGMGYESSARIKVVDMENSKYLYSGRVNGMTKWGGAGTAAFNVGKEIRKILEEKVFPPKLVLLGK